MNRSIKLAHAVLAASQVCSASAQIDRYVVSTGTTGSVSNCFGVAATSDGGCIIVGDGAYPGLIKLNSTGLLDWQRAYFLSPNTSAGTGRGILESSFGGYAMTLFAASSPGFEVGLLRVDSSGVPLWGWLAEADFLNDPTGYKQLDTTRSRQLPVESEAYATIGNRTVIPGTTVSRGVLMLVDATLSQATSVQVSSDAGEVALADIDVSPSGIFILGTIKRPSTKGCEEQMDGLLAWFGLSGNVIQAWTFDSTRLPDPGRCFTDEWGCGIAVDGDTVYFTLADTMAYSGTGNAYVAAFDCSSATLTWSRQILSFLAHVPLC